MFYLKSTLKYITTVLLCVCICEVLFIGTPISNFRSKMASMNYACFVLKCASNFRFCVSTFPEMWSHKVRGYLKIMSMIVLDLCTNVLPIIRFLLHPFMKYEPSKFGSQATFQFFFSENGISELGLIWAQMCP